jgi:hypothetical protein
VRVELCEAWNRPPTSGPEKSPDRPPTATSPRPSVSPARRRSTSTPARARERGHPDLLRALGVVRTPRRQASPAAPRTRRLRALHRRQARPPDALPSARHGQQAGQGTGQIPRPRGRLPLRPSGQPRRSGRVRIPRRRTSHHPGIRRRLRDQQQERSAQPPAPGTRRDHRRHSLAGQTDWQPASHLPMTG